MQWRSRFVGEGAITLPICLYLKIAQLHLQNTPLLERSDRAANFHPKTSDRG
jgi:hypothetical protein